MLIGGQSIDSDRRMEIVDPGDERLVATVAEGDASHIDAAVATAKAAFERGAWSRATPQDRAEVMRRIAAAALQASDELIELEMACNGATIRLATGFHIGYALSHFSYFADLAESYAWQRPAPVETFPVLSQSVVHREPIGVVGAITPWNFPLLLAIWKVGPALAAGNSVVVKPDEHTPLSILEFARIAQRCGLPPGVLNVVPGEGHVAGAPTRIASRCGQDRVHRLHRGRTRNHAAGVGHGQTGNPRTRRQGPFDRARRRRPRAGRRRGALWLLRLLGSDLRIRNSRTGSRRATRRVRRTPRRARENDRGRPDP